MPLKTLLVFAFIGLIALACSGRKEYTATGKVHVVRDGDRFTLIRDQKPFVIKGVAGFTHLKELHDAGGNTIRTWDTTNLQNILDSAQHYNIAVMAGLPLYNSNHVNDYYSDPLAMKNLQQKMEAVVDRYKDHPALLMWCLGNELDYFYEPQDDFFTAYNNLLKMIHQKDPHHPVTTALLNFGKKNIYHAQSKVPDLDLISINTYGRISSLKEDLDSFSWYWDGPFVIGEWGINGYWECDSTAWGAPIEDTSTKKAEQYKAIYETQMPHDNPRYLGSMVFYWGFQHEKTPTWFSMFSDDGARSASIGSLTEIWNGPSSFQPGPPLEYMLIDQKGARDNLIYQPNTVHKAEMVLKQPAGELRLRWEVLPEDWYKEQRDDSNKNKISPPALDSVFSETDGLTATFRAPKTEGPYRVYCWIYDAYGNFASANTPFYVVK
jgi:hypothetical protein